MPGCLFCSSGLWLSTDKRHGISPFDSRGSSIKPIQALCLYFGFSTFENSAPSARLRVTIVSISEIFLSAIFSRTNVGSMDKDVQERFERIERILEASGRAHAEQMAAIREAHMEVEAAQANTDKRLDRIAALVEEIGENKPIRPS